KSPLGYEKVRLELSDLKQAHRVLQPFRDHGIAHELSGGTLTMGPGHEPLKGIHRIRWRRNVGRDLRVTADQDVEAGDIVERDFAQRYQVPGENRKLVAP